MISNLVPRRKALAGRLVPMGFIHRFLFATGLGLVLCLRWSATTVGAQAVDWPTLGFAQMVTNVFTHPTGITHAGDGSGKVFVVEQPGRVWIAESNSVLASPFLDLTTRVLSTGAEQGLLGLAFPPGYGTNHHFYVDYTRLTDGAIVISRFFLSAAANLADASSEQIIKVIPKPFSTATYNNHNAGQLAFGPDGLLYIGVGDGGSEGDPQNYGQKTSTLFGKILRIDVESGVSPYAIPTSNPLVTNTNFAPETWAYGLRNPWRFSFDRLTGDLYIGDVGQNSYEEVDFQPAGSTGGQNYGWRIMEGPTNYIVPPGFTNFSTLTLPVAWYSHLILPTDDSGAVIGGYVYRGPGSPRMSGVYFYGDFEAGWIWGLKQTGTNWQNLPLLAPGNTPTNFLISTFGEDDQGALYLADYYRGKVYQVQDTLRVWPPACSPTNGFDSNSNNVIVSCVTTGAVIHFTNTGIDPTASDPVVLSGGAISVANGITNKFRAYRADLTASTVVTAIFTNKVGTPVFAPLSGYITSNTVARISSVTPGVKIYYTTNGAIPTTNSSLYTGPWSISGGITPWAIGVAAGYSNSALGGASYYAAVAAAPVFSPASGPITNGTFITISCSTPGAVLYYTLDGTTPDTSSSVYSAPFPINGGVTVCAIAVVAQYVNSGQNTLYALVQTALPSFRPATGPITNGTPVTITCATPSSTIYYTLDGSPPTTNSAVYSGPVTILGGTTVSAYATAGQHLDSAVQSAFYQLVQTATPVFSPASGPVTQGTSVTISCATPGSKIYYTLDGSTPTMNSPLYATPLTLQADTNLNAYAVASGHQDSPVQSAFYTLIPAATPVFSPAQGPLTNGTLIHLGTASSNAVIRYTIDGTDPQTATSAFTYATPIVFTNPMTLTARAYRADLDPSGAQSVAYILYDFENTVVTTLAGGPTAGFSNAIGRLATFDHPQGICMDKTGSFYVADTRNNVIRKISPTGQVSTFAGTGVAGSKLGVAATAQFSDPTGVASDNAGNIYVADAGNCNRICKIAANGMVTSLSDGLQGCVALWQIGVDPSGNIDFGSGMAVEQIQPNGTAVTLGGYFAAATVDYECAGGWCPGVGIGIDASTNVYATTASVVWQIKPDGTTTLFAGSGANAYGTPNYGYCDGSRLLSLFEGPQDAAVDRATNIFISDVTRVRKIRSDGWVSTLAGTGGYGYQNGPGSGAQFNGADGLCVETNGNIFVADSANNCIREISPDTYGMGIPDWWQLAHFGYVGIDPNADPDHDGLSNYEEFWAGTDPLNASSGLAIDLNSFVSNGHAAIRWQTVAGKAYTVEYSTDLRAWNNLGGPVQGDGTMATVNDPAPLSKTGQCYYRVAVTGF